MYPVSALYRDATRNSLAQTTVCDAYRDGYPIATDLPVVSGSVTDDSKPGVRRTLDTELFPTPGLYDLLAPIGTELRPRSVIRYPSGATETVPFGVFDIDSQSMSYGTDGTIKVKGSDKWARIQRARFLRPQASTPGRRVTNQIASLVRGALGESEPVVITATSTATVGALVWERDRDKAINDLAESIGARVSFDRDGVCVVEDLPTTGTSAVWTVDDSPTGVMLGGSRDRDRQRTYNVVVAASDKADGEAPFAPVIVWDNDPGSPTYAGYDPVSAPGAAGPFGVVPYFHTSPLLNDATQASRAARTILARVTGMASQLSLEFVRNHALDSLDVIDALLPAEQPRQIQVGSSGGAGFGVQAFGSSPFGVGSGAPIYGPDPSNQPLERHIIDRIVHPLLPTGANTVDTRSTRTDEFT